MFIFTSFDKLRTNSYASTKTQVTEIGCILKGIVNGFLRGVQDVL